MSEPKDYSPWKVVDLKAELKRRGITQTGLRVKQQLIDRLIQDDSESNDQPVAEDKQEQSQKDTAPTDSEAATAPTTTDVTEERPVAEEKAASQSQGDTAPTAGDDDDVTPAPTNAAKEREQEPGSQQEEQKQEPSAEKSDEDRTGVTDKETAPAVDQTQHNEEHKEEPTEKREAERTAPEPTEQESQPQITSTDAIEQENPKSPIEEPMLSPRQKEETREEVTLEDKQEHVTAERVASNDEKEEKEEQETNKRKRRETSPSPSEQVKKSKGEDGSALTRETEAERNAQPEGGAVPDGDEKPPSHTETAPSAEKETREDVNTKPETEQEAPKDDVKTEEKPAPAISTDVAKGYPEEPEKSTDRQTSMERRSVPTSARSPKKDNRFKELFPARSTVDRPPSPVREESLQERSVSPAVHPATKALYITNLMRPMQPRVLKSHLLALAAPDADPDSEPSVMPEFFLDSIRTHCFVIFDSTAAAARVRTALHNAIWPAEAMRKPLWVDFVSEDKVKSWIDQEQDAASARSGPLRWEVVYRKDDEGTVIDTYLQEVNLGGGAPARPPPGPSASLFDRVVPAPSARFPDRSSGFKPLDERFLATTAKPRLYYLPVVKDVSERRLDQFDDLRKAAAQSPPPIYGPGSGKRKYTFEDTDQFVDAGAEFGFPGGGGGNGGGGPRRGGRGRAGGFFGRRDRGDHWSRNGGDQGWRGRRW